MMPPLRLSDDQPAHRPMLVTRPCVSYSGIMDMEDTISALAALAQGTRLDVFRLLVRHEPEGLPAGEIARQMAVPHNTMSTHLGILTRAGLIRPERRSRQIIYRADLGTLRDVLAFLLKDCCGGHAEICAPLIVASIFARERMIPASCNNRSISASVNRATLAGSKPLNAFRNASRLRSTVIHDSPA